MSAVNENPHSDKIDPLLAYVIRAQARARLFFEAELPYTEEWIVELIGERPDFMHEEEAGLIIRCAMRQYCEGAKRRGYRPWL
jgi:hypothetical protein